MNTRKRWTSFLAFAAVPASVLATVLTLGQEARAEVDQLVSQHVNQRTDQTADQPIGEATPTPELVSIQFDRVYVPEDFDSDDHVKIVAKGTFPNKCYRVASTQVDVSHEAMRIQLTPVAFKYSGFCIQVETEFVRVIDVGDLKVGTYVIYQKGTRGQDRELGSITVKDPGTAATPAVSDGTLY